MPFKDNKEGTTHYQNDGCGVKEHNNMPKLLYHLEPNTPLHDEIKDNNLAQEQLLSALRQARLAAFDEVLAVLPDEDRKINIEDSNTVWPHFGWNAYRSEAIEAINKLREV